MAGENVSSTLKEALLETLSTILSPVQEVRSAGEEQLKALEVTEEFGVHLAELTVNVNGPLPIRQLASVLLKQYVETHWCSNSEKYRAPETSEPAKSAVRAVLSRGLVDPVSKVRTSIAYAISAIATWDWPEAWPELFDLLMSLLISGEVNAVHGAMRVLTEFSREVTAPQMPQVAPVVLPEIYKIFLDSQKYSLRTRGRAVEILCTFSKMIADMGECHRDFPRKYLFPILPAFTEAMVHSLQQPNGESSDTGLKIEVIKMLTVLVSFYPKQVNEWLPQILPPVWNILTAGAETYVKTVVNGTEELVNSVDSDGDSLGFENLVFSVFDFVNALIDTPRFRKTVGKGIPDLLYYLIAYMQITEEQVTLWTTDPDRFVEEEDEDTFSYTVRISSQDLLGSLSSEFEEECGPSLAAAVSRHLQEAEHARAAGNPHWWKIHEACLLALGNAKSQMLQAGNQFDLTRFMHSVVLPDLGSNASPFLLGRCLWIASKFASSTDEEIIQRFLQATVSVLQENNLPTVRISAVKAAWGFCEHLKSSGKTQSLHPYLSPMFEGIISLATAFSDDVMTLSLDTLVCLLEVDPEFTASVESRVTPISIAVFLKHSSDPLLMSITSDIFKCLCKVPKCQAAVEERLIPTLVSILNASSDKIPSGFHSAALELMQTVVQGSTVPLSDLLMTQAFPAVIHCTLNAEDNATLQGGGECIRGFLISSVSQVISYQDNEGHNGLWYVVEIVTQLLNPRSSEHAATFVGRLITSLLRHAGQQLGDSLELLLKAVLSKMQQAETISVMQSLILVFCHLVHTQFDGLLSFLSGVPGPTGQSALEFVLTEWCSKHHLFYGSYETKVSTIALCRLLEYGVTSNDKRIVDIQVKGDMIQNRDPNNQVKTRLQTQLNPPKWTVVPLVVKILKLIINELANAFEESLAKGKEIDYDESDGWEEEEEGEDNDDDFGCEMSNNDDSSLTHVLNQLANQHSEMMSGYDDVEEDDDEDPDELNDPLYHTNLQLYLTEFLNTFSRQAAFQAFTSHLTAQETKVLNTVGITVS